MATPAAQPEPLLLDQIEQSGAMRFGQPVSRVVVYLANGKRLSLELPEPGEGAERTSALSPAQRRILGILSASTTPLPRKIIAGKLGLSSPKGQFGLDVRVLVSEGHAYEHAGEITDDASKFPAPS